MDVFRPGGLELTEKSARLLGLKERDRVLDIGCGLGGSLSFLTERFGIEPWGVDISQETVRRSGKSYITQGDACSLPFPEGEFDCVLMECVLSMIERPETAVSEAERVLKRGGSLAVSALSGEGLGTLAVGGRVDFTELRAQLESRGFQVLAIEDEKDCLRQFAAEAIFRYGSLKEYAEAALRELGGSVIGCEAPARGTGYMLLLARKA